MANFEGPKWGSTTQGSGATVTLSFAELDLTSQMTSRGFSGYLTFESAISSQYRGLVRQAMDAWEAVANIDLVESSDGVNVGIRIGNREINTANVVGETTFWSVSGGTRMSAAEVYFDSSAYGGNSLYQIAVHEIGHALGLDHSNLTSAVMYYMVNSQNRSGTLTNDDVNGIQTLYGAKAVQSSSLATLQTAFTNILRINPASTDALKTTIALTDGSSVANPTFGQAQGLATLAAQVDAGLVSLSRAITNIGHYADATTSVASLSYQFFTGKTPTSAGLDFLVYSGTNPNDLNDPYYAKFNLENRYINFAVNLGKLGEGQPAFQTGYGALSLNDAVKKAYTEIFGAAPTDQKVIDILTPDRVTYLTSFGLDGANGIGTKAAAVGFLMAEAVKADIGPYALANDKFMTDLADGVASYNVSLKTVYALQSEPEAPAQVSYDMHTDSVVEMVGVPLEYAA